MGLELLAVGSLGSMASLLYGSIKLGNFFSRRSAFNKIAKFILVKIFNEVKDNDKIRELASKLKAKFEDKPLKELISFIKELAEIELKQKEYNFDTFFTEHREDIIKNIQNIKDYFIKRQVIEEFSLFVFSRFYDSHINISFYKDFQDGLIYDFVLESRVSPEELMEKIELIYIEASKIDTGNYNVMEKHFLNQQKDLLDLVVSMKKKSTKKTSKRVFDFLKDNIEALKITKEMVVNGAAISKINNKQVLGSVAVSIEPNTLSIENDFLNKLNEIKRNL